MGITQISESLGVFFPGCPFTTRMAAVTFIKKEMEDHGVKNPEDYFLALEYGAKWRIHSIPNTAWYSPVDADKNRILYLSERHRAQLTTAWKDKDYSDSIPVPRF